MVLCGFGMFWYRILVCRYIESDCDIQNSIHRIGARYQLDDMNVCPVVSDIDHSGIRLLVCGI